MQDSTQGRVNPTLTSCTAILYVFYYCTSDWPYVHLCLGVLIVCQVQKWPQLQMAQIIHYRKFQLSTEAFPQQFLFSLLFASNSSAHLIAIATPYILLTHSPSSTDFGLPTLLAYNYMIFCSYLFFLDLTKVPRSLSLLALSCIHLYTLEITHNYLLQQFFGKDG